MGRFDGKVAIVTGAGRGIGRAHALLLAREGASVLVNDLGGDGRGEGADATPAQQVADEIVQAGGVAAVNGADVSDWEASEAMVAQAVGEFGRLDVLVNNAGILRDRMSFNMSEEDFDAVVNVVLKGTFAPSRHAAAHWRQVAKSSGESVGGAIVNTSSEAGLYGNLGQANYASAKMGVAALTITMARELERVGVRVNCIAPAAATRLMATVSSHEAPDDESAYDPMAPEQIAPLVAWLCSDDADGVNGQVFSVHGSRIQLLRGWRPATEVSGDEQSWTIERIEGLRAELLGDQDPGIPPFMPPRS